MSQPQPLATNRGRLVIGVDPNEDNFAENKVFECQVQGFNIPGISTTPVFVGTPSEYDLYVPGDTILFEDLNTSVLLDENLDIFNYFFQWIQHNARGKRRLVDMSIISQTNKGNSNRAFHYYNAFPYNISGVEYSYENPDTEAVVQIIFKFSHFAIKPVGSL